MREQSSELRRNEELSLQTPLDACDYTLITGKRKYNLPSAKVNSFSSVLPQRHGDTEGEDSVFLTFNSLSAPLCPCG